MTAARFYSSTAGSMELQADITNSSTTMQVDSTTGLPGTTPFTLVIDPGTTEEIVDCTGVAGTSLTIVRGRDGSPAQSHSAGAVIRHMATARDFREAQEHIGNTVAHGLASAVVGLTDAQTLTNKNLTSATNTFPASLATDAELAAHTGLTAAHGATGAVVGTTNNQALTNKDLSSPTNTFPSSLATDTELANHAVTATSVHGTTGDVVGTDNTQALTNKNLTAPSNSFPATLATTTVTDGLNTRLTVVEGRPRVKVGQSTLIFNGSGEVTLTHGLGTIPTFVSAVAHAANAGAPIIVVPKIGTVTTTTVILCAYNIAAGAIYTGTLSAVSWQVGV